MNHVHHIFILCDCLQSKRTLKGARIANINEVHHIVILSGYCLEDNKSVIENDTFTQFAHIFYVPT